MHLNAITVLKIYCFIMQTLMNASLTMEGVTTSVSTLLVALSAVANPGYTLAGDGHTCQGELRL